jgi:hypothetical protein
MIPIEQPSSQEVRVVLTVRGPGIGSILVEDLSTR